MVTGRSTVDAQMVYLIPCWRVNDFDSTTGGRQVVGKAGRRFVPRLERHRLDLGAAASLQLADPTVELIMRNGLARVTLISSL